MEVLYYYKNEINKEELLNKLLFLKEYNNLYNLIKDDKLIKGEIILIYDNNELVSFCTVSDKTIIESSLSPWIDNLYYKENKYLDVLLDEVNKYCLSLGKSRYYLLCDKLKKYEQLGFNYLFNKVDNNIEYKIYYKALTNIHNNAYKSIELTGEDDNMLKDRKNKKEYKNVCDTHWDGA